MLKYLSIAAITMPKAIISLSHKEKRILCEYALACFQKTTSQDFQKLAEISRLKKYQKKKMQSVFLGLKTCHGKLDP